MDAKSISKAFFRFFNRFMVVPAFKRGLGWIVSNPLTGHIMVLKITGRKTGKIHYTPVGYAMVGKRIYCYQGRRMKGQWYLNLRANPQVEVLLPHGRLSGRAEDVKDIPERLQAMRQILKDGGLGGFIYGFNPYTASDEIVQDKIKDIAVVRITPIKQHIKQ